MSKFIDNAVAIIESAETAMMTGYTPSEYSILLGSGGSIRMIANSDWPLESLQREHGAQVAYRIASVGGRIIVDGREGGRTCRLEAKSVSETARFLLNSTLPWYGIAQGDIASLAAPGI